MAIERRKVLAEFLGSFFLVLTIALNTSAVFTVLSVAAVLVVCVYAMGPVSGGHFNPAVTLAVALLGKIDALSAGAYMTAQVIGAQVARCVAFALYTRPFYLAEAYSSGPAAPYSVELVYTFMLVYVVLNVACQPTTDPSFGLAIGGVIVAGGYGAGKISSGAFNPAVASTFDPGCMVPCMLGEAAGSFLAWGLFVSVVCDAKHHPLSSKLALEFIGTFMLVVTAALNVLNGSPAKALSIGFSLACVIFADRGVSGGHFNPAVTLAMASRGQQTEVAALYMLTQSAAGVCAGVFSSVVAGSHEAWAVDGAFTPVAAFEELVYTFLLCFVILAVATVSKPQSFNGLTIGLCVVAGGNAAVHSGGHLNPAVSLGLLAANGLYSLEVGFVTCVGYCSMQLLGGLLAAALFWDMFADEFKAHAREYRVLPGGA